MILQALCEYYKREASDPTGNIAPEGWEWKEIPFLAVIDGEGNFKCFQDTREKTGNKKQARKFLVPSLGEKKGGGIKSNLLWENVEYMFGIPMPTENKPNPDKERVKRQHIAFGNKIKALNGNIDSINVLKKFVSKDQIDCVKKDPIWREVQSLNQNILIAIDGNAAITDLPEIRHVVTESLVKSTNNGICLVTGDNGEIVRLEPPIKGVKGANTMGASLVAINNEIKAGKNTGQTPAFASYMKQQGFNSPISKIASFSYTTALNTLLGKNSQNKVIVGDSTVVFWAQMKSNSYDFESDFPWYFRTDKDDPDKGTKAVKNLYDALHTGKLPFDEGNRFYVLGLAPNAARISVRFWKTGTICDFAEKIKQHFDDFKIVHSPMDNKYLALNQILSAIVFEYKMENVPANLAGSVVACILDGTPYPQTLLQQCIRRIRAEQQVTRACAAIFKAYFNRFNRFHNQQKKEVNVALDLENRDVGYLLGRLFAVLERVQVQSAGGEGKLNTTIRDRFYGAFSSSPITVMPMLLKLKNHHIAKIENGKIFFEGLIGQVMDGLNVHKIPAHLTLEQQAHLAVGYYHQRQDFYKKKDVQN